MNVPGKGGEHLLLVSSEACVLLDGQELAPIWTFSAAQVLRYRVFSRNPCGCCKLSTPSPSSGHSMDAAPIVAGRIHASASSLFTWCCPALEGPMKPPQLPVPQWTLGQEAQPCPGASKEMACIPVPGISSQRPFSSSPPIFSFQKTHPWPLHT